MNHSLNIKPTDSELEILQVLWSLKKGSVRTVHEILCQHKESGYTTTLKLMQIMHEKGLVNRDESQKTHIYTPAITKESTQGHLVKKMINNLFAGSSTDLVLQAIGQARPSNEELEKISAFLAVLQNKK